MDRLSCRVWPPGQPVPAVSTGEGGVREAAPYIVYDCKSIIRPGRAGKMMQK